MVYGFFYSRKISNGTYFQASSGNDFQASITDDFRPVSVKYILLLALTVIITSNKFTHDIVLAL